MISKKLIAIVFIIIFIINLYADSYKKQALKVMTKPLLVPLIILFYLTSGAHINYFVVAALFFGFLGDLSLLWSSRKIYFAIGLFEFLIGHMFYILAFLQSVQYFKVVPAWYFIFLIPYAVYGCAILKAINITMNNMKVPAVVYMCAILMMSFTSSWRIWNGFDLQFFLPFLGSLFFIASDSILAYNSFDTPGKNYETSIMITYILAQLLIVAGFLIK